MKSPALRDILIEINKDVEGLSLLKEPPFVSKSVIRKAGVPLLRMKRPFDFVGGAAAIGFANHSSRVVPGKVDASRPSAWRNAF